MGDGNRDETRQILANIRPSNGVLASPWESDLTDRETR